MISLEAAERSISWQNKLRRFWIKKEDEVNEWIRMKFVTIAATILSAFNVIVLGWSGFCTWLDVSFNIPLILYLPLHDMSWPILIALFNLPILTWFISTSSMPIKKGYKNIIDWSKTERGRRLALLVNLIPFVWMVFAIMSRYIAENYAPFLESVSVDTIQHNYLLVKDFSSFLVFLYILPILLVLFFSVLIYRHFSKNEDLKNQFYKWEFGLMAKHMYALSAITCDVIVGWDKENGKPLVLKEKARFLHELVVGVTGSGKTSTTILLRITQDLVRIAKGSKISVVALEPKGDLVADVLKIARRLGIPESKIKVIDPVGEGSVKFNPFYGPLDTAASSFRGTLDALTGDQDEFFKGQQNETAALYTMLAKLRFRNLTDVNHIQQMYTDPRYLANITEQVREEVDSTRESPTISEADKKVLDMYERIVRYFEDEVLDYKTYRDRDNIYPLLYPQGHRYAGKQQVESKKDKYVTGAKKYLNEISMNALLSDLMITKENEQAVDFDTFLDEGGGVLLCNTALGELQDLSLMFGQFFIRQFQASVFRRPKEEDGYVRNPCFFYVDEFPLFSNESFERFLTLGRSYKVGTMIAIQNLGQLDALGKGYRQTIIANASSKTVFGRGPLEDNEFFSKDLGEAEMVEESLNESTTPLTVDNPSWSYRHNTQRKLQVRFSPTKIKELPFKHMIVSLVDEEGSIQEPRVAKGKFVTEAKFLTKYMDLHRLDLASDSDAAVDVVGAIHSAQSKMDEFIGDVTVTEEERANTKTADVDEWETVVAFEEPVFEEISVPEQKPVPERAAEPTPIPATPDEDEILFIIEDDDVFEGEQVIAEPVGAPLHPEEINSYPSEDTERGIEDLLKQLDDTPPEAFTINDDEQYSIDFDVFEQPAAPLPTAAPMDKESVLAHTELDHVEDDL